MALKIACIPALSDNYIWMVHDEASGETLVIDPGEAQPVLDAAAHLGWTASQIWNTHWHADHTGGNAALKAATGARLTGPAREADRIADLDAAVDEGDTLSFAGHAATVMHVPGHTAGHVAYHFAAERILFSGDTLFAMGCGRLFEGTAAQMYANMRRFAAMPDDTIVYGAHEYTAANGRFALVAEPDSSAIRDRMVGVTRKRAAGEPTLPTTIGEERATNPFLRARDVEEFSDRRRAKDSFRG